MASIGPIDWVEHVNSVSPSAASYARDETRMVIVGDVDFDAIVDGSAVQAILGYSTTGNAPLIKRFPPMKCPLNPSLYATKITACQFLNPLGNDMQDGADTPYAVYEKARLTVLFESLPYDILTDQEMTQLGQTDEFYRWCLRKVNASVEQISRPSNSFGFANGPMGVLNANFPQSLIARSSKRTLTIDWLGIPKLCVLDPSTEPWNFEDETVAASVGCVNNATWHGYRRGECLLLGVDTTPHVEPVPPELLGFTASTVPRSYDYKFHISIYQPPYDPTVLGASGYHTFGHQTAPSASLAAGAGNLYFYQIARPPSGGGVASTNVNVPSAWLYPEVDFDQLFQTLA